MRLDSFHPLFVINIFGKVIYIDVRNNVKALFDWNCLMNRACSASDWKLMEQYWRKGVMWEHLNILRQKTNTRYSWHRVEWKQKKANVWNWSETALFGDLHGENHCLSQFQNTKVLWTVRATVVTHKSLLWSVQSFWNPICTHHSVNSYLGHAHNMYLSKWPATTHKKALARTHHVAEK